MALYDKGLINATAIMGELSADLDEALDERTEEAAKLLVKIAEKNAKYGVEIDPRSVRLMTSNEQTIGAKQPPSQPEQEEDEEP
jgi:hypothetical protein